MSRIAALAALFLLLLFACSDLSLLSPQTSASASIEVVGLARGAIVQPGEPIRFVVRSEKDGKSALLLEIALTNASGQSVWSASQEPSTDEELSLRLPEGLETGLYRLTFSLIRSGSPAVSREVSFFYVRGPYGITGVSSFPPTIQPENRILLKAELVYPQGDDPYLRWTQLGSLLGQGRASEGFGQLSWQAPKQEGVYAVQVELFPTAPASGTDYPFSSSLASTVQLYVASAAAAADELAPKDSYFCLFRFAGSLRDELSAQEAEAFGSAVPLPEGRRGYRLAPGSGIRWPRLILPTSDGLLAPCTLTLRLTLEPGNAGRELLSVAGPNQDFRLVMSLDAQGSPQALLNLPGAPDLSLPSGIKALSAGEPHRLDLSLIPSPKTLTALWFLDGEQTSTVSLRTETGGLAEEGQTLIGGENGFSGRIHELGVYYRDDRKRPTPDPGIYRFMMERKHGRRLALAEGFEGLYLPEGFAAEPPSSVRMAEGRLALAPGAVLTLPFFDLNGTPTEETVLEIFLAAPLPPDAAAVLSWEGDGKAFLEIRGEGSALAPGGSRLLARFPPLTDSLSLSIGAERLALQTSSGPLILELPPPAGRERWLKLALRSPPSEKGLLLERLLVYRKNGK